jgi:HlyD family secretion protein
MASETKGGALRELHTLFSVGTLRDFTDGQLLERFATDRREGAERAFAALVERHGPMVLRVCRGVLADPDDAEDAFQATFLVLVKRAQSLWVRDSLGPWLHQVAFRTASSARKSAARRRRHERLAADFAHVTHSELKDELGRTLHDEINRLPDRFRAPVVLCDLEGRTHEQAARHLGWPIGTVKSRQSRARERLRQRLLRYGHGSSAGLPCPSVLVPPALVDSTTRAVVHFARAQAIARGSAALLAQGVLKSMFVARCFKIASFLVVAGATVPGVEMLVRGGSPSLGVPNQPNSQAARTDDRPVQEVRPGNIRLEAIERGHLEPSHTEEAVSQVEGLTSIIFIVPDGSQVKKGDRICDLDAASLRDTLVNQTIASKSAEAAYANARLAREVAEIALVEYVEGILKGERDSLKSMISRAEKAYQKATVRLERTRTIEKRVKGAMALKGSAANPADMVAELDVEDRLEAAQDAVEREKMALEQAKAKLEGLEKYTSKKQIDQLKAEIEHKRSDELAKQAAWRLEKSKETKIRKQIDNCKFSASFDGRVFVANDPKRTAARPPQIQAGALVRERQTLFYLVDSSGPVRVNTKVHEAIVDKIEPGQRTRITVDALPALKLTGVVKIVAPLPDVDTRVVGRGVAAGDLDNDGRLDLVAVGRAQKRYTTLVEIDNPPPDLRAGMTARVEILVAERNNVLRVPVQAVVRFDGKEHVAVKKAGGGFEWREVTWGLSDQEVVEIKTGLNSGELVALEPLALMTEEERRQKLGSPPSSTEPAVRKKAPR